MNMLHHGDSRIHIVKLRISGSECFLNHAMSIALTIMNVVPFEASRAMEMLTQAQAHPKAGKRETLFVIHRSVNRNCVVFKGEEATGIEAFWVMFEKDGNPTEGLSYSEKRNAFGFKCKAKGMGAWALQMNVLKDRRITVTSPRMEREISGDRWCARTRINGVDDVELLAVHVQMQEGQASGLLPDAVEYVELFGAGLQYELKRGPL